MKKKTEHIGLLTPRMATYDGKMDWRPYHLQFSIIADRYKWTKEQRLFKRIGCLRDKALICYSEKSASVHYNYSMLCSKINERFGKKDMLKELTVWHLMVIQTHPKEWLKHWPLMLP